MEYGILARSDTLKLTPYWKIFFLQTHILISLTDGLEVFVMFLSLVWTLILTAPMYCRGSIGEQVIIIYFSKSYLINKLINILEGLRVCTFWVIYSFMFHHITTFCSTEEIKTAVFWRFYSDTIPNSSSEHLQIDSLARQKHKLHEQDDIYFLAFMTVYAIPQFLASSS